MHGDGRKTLVWLGVVVTFLTLASPVVSRTLEAAMSPTNDGQPGQQHLVNMEMEEEQADLHPIDVCIISCDLCFKNEALVYCANACIISDGAMDRNWRKICRVFDGQLNHHHPSFGFR